MDSTQSEFNKTSVNNGQESNLGALTVFSDNNHFFQLHKKTEKLVTAVYMVTNFIKDNEPLKGKLREKSLELLTLNMSFISVSLSDRLNLIKKYQLCSLEVISLVNIAMHSGIISSMNGEILNKEFTAIISNISREENKDANEETVILGPEFFGSNERNTPKENNVLYASKTTPAPKVLSNSASTKREPVIKDMKPTRQDAILKLLSKKSGLNIKDFTDTVKGVSAKTIQRELLSMVASGVLKKEGERRWSTYSLAK